MRTLPEDARLAIAENVRHLRLKHDTRVFELAKEIDQAAAVICRWESATQTPSIFWLMTLAQWGGVRVDDLLRPRKSWKQWVG